MDRFGTSGARRFARRRRISWTLASARGGGGPPPRARGGPPPPRPRARPRLLGEEEARVAPREEPRERLAELVRRLEAVGGPLLERAQHRAVELGRDRVPGPPLAR